MKKFLGKLLRILNIVLLCLLGLVILLVVSFYIPPVQDYIFKKVTGILNKGDSGIHIEYSSLRVKFPTHLVGEDLKVALPGDIDASIGYIDANINVLPLLKLDISSKEIEIIDAKFKLGAPDSSIYLKAAIDTFGVNDISVNLKESTINLSNALVNGADVSLDIGESKEKEDTTTDKPAKSFVIDAGNIAMNRLNYRMSIYPGIDTIASTVDHVDMKGGHIDLNLHTISVESFDVDVESATYIFSPSGSDTAEESPAKDIDEPVDSLPWTIRVNEIDLSAAKALYARKGAVPEPGFDPDYIRASGIKIEIDSFYNCRQDIRVPIKQLRAYYDSSLLMEASGTFAIDSSEIKADNFNVSLPGSVISANALMGLVGDRFHSQADCPVKADIDATIAPGDVAFLLPSLKPILNSLPPYTPIIAKVDASGTMDNLVIDELLFELPRYLRLWADGEVAGFNSPDLKDLWSNLKFEGRLSNPNILKPSVIEARLGKGVHLIPFTIGGAARFRNGSGQTDLKVTTAQGDISLDGKLNFRAQGYSLDFKSRNFPIQSIMPGLGLADVSVSADATGVRFNPLAKGAKLDASVTIDKLLFHNKPLEDIRAEAKIAEGRASLKLSSQMDEADFLLHADGNIYGKEYRWTLDGNIRNLELQDLGFSKDENGGSMLFYADATMNTDSMLVNASIDFPSINWNINDRAVTTSGLAIHFNADKSSTSFDINDHDLLFEINSPQPLDSIMKRLPLLTGAIDSCMRQGYLNVRLIQRSLPVFNADFTAKKNNIVSRWLADRGEYFDSLGIRIRNDSLLSLKATLEDYNTPKYIVDSITADIFQKNDSLDFKFHLVNSPMSPGDWADVKLWGRVGGDQLDVRFHQENHEGKTGFLLGFDGQYADSTVTINFVPDKPVIGYKQWTVNPDNFISVDFADRHLDANLSVSHGNSSLRLYTDHIDGSNEQEEINLQLTDIEIADWIALNPFATPMKGLLSGKVSLSHEGKIFTGDGHVTLKDYTYGKKRVGTFDLNLDVSTTPGGFIHAGADLDIDSVKVLKLYGVLNDTTANEPFMLDLAIDSLPLKVANPFLADAGISLSGHLDGEMKVTGEPTSPVFNGFIDFDSTGVTVKMIGTTYYLSDIKIPVDTGIVIFDNYQIKAVNDNPLVIDGTVNMRDILDPAINLTFKARDTQLVGTDRARGGAEIYGKAFIDLDATVKGNMEYLAVDASADILNTTNVTYVMVGGAQSALTSRSNSNLVKFVNFADTSMVMAADSIKLTGMAMNINALLKISRGAVISVDLSSDGKNKVQLEPVGDLDYSMDVLGGQHLTGRITIDGGFARYTPPLMSEKMFTFKDGSYIDFNGNISNPLLNIHAVDRLRANVTQEGQNSRLIYFNIGLDVTGSLENMNVHFDLSTDDDLTVENELESMSPSQRESKAINLLITNMYTGPGTTADANLGANALYSFLSSQLNSWAANNIKAVDLSFGVNQYENTTDGISTQATSYSYKVSKSLFNDRFKINVGGNYTTDADPDENLTENLISDISLEYMLNKNGSMYIKLFRHAGYESILEGEVIQTGIAVDYRKRMDSLKKMFWFFYPRKKNKDDKNTEKNDSAIISQADSTRTAVTDIDPATMGKATDGKSPDNSLNSDDSKD